MRAAVSEARERGALDRLPKFWWSWCNSPKQEAAFREACSSVELLKFAIEQGMPWGTYVCEAAAKEGNLEVLRFARENGCEWDQHTCYYSAMFGHLDLLQYARANGCPWIKDDCLAIAAALGRKEVEMWAASQDP